MTSSDRPTTGTGRLAGKVAIVTGAGSGIGKAAAAIFAANGASVVVVDRRSDTADATAHDLEQSGHAAIALAADVSQAADLERVVADTIRRFGRLDCAFNNAGILGSMLPIVDLSEQDFDEVVAVNLKSVWLSMKYELQAITRLGNGGAIVNTSSFLAVGATAGTSAYSASKAALDAMIRAVALEVGPIGIRVNNVRPGVTDTPMLRAHGGDEELAPFAAHAALKRLGKPEDVADVAVWLCTDEARFVTGQSVLVDGGFTIAGMR